jgi:hypothetical protein
MLVAYTAILGVRALREQSNIAAQLRASGEATADPHARGELVGRRVAGWTKALGWILAAGLLLTGRSWGIEIVAVAYLVSARRAYAQFALGFAEGLKAAELAAAPEYVRGRAVPGARERSAALLYVLVTRLVPVGALLVALTWIGR